MSVLEMAYHRLLRSGWSIGDTPFARPPGVAWLVAGHSGESLIRVEGQTREEAVGQTRSSSREAVRTVGE